jgi:hypothetical protein
MGRRLDLRGDMLLLHARLARDAVLARAFIPFDEWVLFDFAFEEIMQLEIGKLEKPNCLLQLRGNNKGLGLP